MIKHIIQPKEKELGGFSVRRLLPSAEQQMVGPWIFFDHMGPTEFVAGKGVDVRPHPHIGLATVTYLFEGELLHRDSLGYVQAIKPGDINLMVAGKGIVHSERETEIVRNQNHCLHGLQLWHVLPEQKEGLEPAFYHHAADQLPHTTEGGVPLRVMMGSAYGLTSAVKTFVDTLYVEAQLQPNDTLPLPQAQQLAVYVVSGAITLQQQVIPQYHLVILQDGEQATIQASEASRIAIIGGAKMSKRFIEWNFVSSHKERIEEAKEDWRAQRFATIPGDDEEFIALPG